MKVTSKVLNRWYTQFKHEESIYYSVSHRDYIISMYEIIGSTQSMKQFSSKWYSVFSFMLNRYIKQKLIGDLKIGLKKIIVSFKKDANTFYAIDFTEEEKAKVNNRFISPIKNNRNLPDVVNALLSSKNYFNNLIDMSSPSNSGNITPIRDKILIEDHDFLNSASPQNYSFLINSNKNQFKGKFISKIDPSSDYILRKWVENPHCSKITNTWIIKESILNRIGNQKQDDLTFLKGINSWIIIPIKINEDLDITDENETVDVNSIPKNQIGVLELYFNDQNNKVEFSQFDDNKWLNSLIPIFSLLRDIVVNETKNEFLKEFEETKLNEIPSQIDESKASITTSFLIANKKTNDNALVQFTQSSKLQSSLSQMLYNVSLEIPKILLCEKSIVILIVETPNKNILGGPTKTAYFYSFSDNHTYNFNYDGTFVDKILETRRPITFTFSNYSGPALAFPAWVKNSMNANFPKNISNESFHTIRYLPIQVSIKKRSKIVAILETWYNEATVISTLLHQNENSYISDMTEEEEKMINIIDHNASLLSGFADAFGTSELEEKKISFDHKNMEHQCSKVIGKRVLKWMHKIDSFIKASSKCISKLDIHTMKMRFSTWKLYTQRLKNMNIEDYKKELEEKSTVIDELKKQNMILHENINDIMEQNGTNHKLKSGIKLFAAVWNKYINGILVRRAFDNWRSDHVFRIFWTPLPRGRGVHFWIFKNFFFAKWTPLPPLLIKNKINKNKVIRMNNYKN